MQQRQRQLTERASHVRKCKNHDSSQVLALHELRQVESQSQSRRASSPSTQDRAVQRPTGARRSGDIVGEPWVCYNFF